MKSLLLFILVIVSLSLVGQRSPKLEIQSDSLATDRDSFHLYYQISLSTTGDLVDTFIVTDYIYSFSLNISSGTNKIYSFKGNKYLIEVNSSKESSSLRIFPIKNDPFLRSFRLILRTKYIIYWIEIENYQVNKVIKCFRV